VFVSPLIHQQDWVLSGIFMEPPLPPHVGAASPLRGTILFPPFKFCPFQISQLPGFRALGMEKKNVSLLFCWLSLSLLSLIRVLFISPPQAVSFQLACRELSLPQDVGCFPSPPLQASFSRLGRIAPPFSLDLSQRSQDNSFLLDPIAALSRSILLPFPS